ncbi:MAG: ATP-grasp domain-containing protein [Bacteroidetes bacterium]|nr:ATP-grasp domain-containing protein [Bacteroidota bacterium]
MQKKLLILGASFSYIGSIIAAKEMGLKVLVTDRNPKAPGLKYADLPLSIDIIDIEGCLEAAKKYNIDGIIAVNDFGVMTAAHVAEAMQLPGIPVDIAKICTNKYLMRKTWESAGLPSIKFRRVSNLEEAQAAVNDLGFPLIIKPCDSRGGGSRGVQYIDENSDLDSVFSFANGFYKDNDLIIEEFVTGLEHSSEVIITEGKPHIIAISDKVKSTLPFRVDDTILYPTIETGKRLEQIEWAIKESIKAIGIRDGVAHVELSMTDSGPVLFEIGARCGGGAPAPLVPYLTGVQQFQEAARIAVGEKPIFTKPLYNKGCVIKFYYPEPGIVREISGIEQVEGVKGVLSFALFAEIGSLIKSLRTCSDRAGMVITGAETREEALSIANEIINLVEIKTTPINENELV